MANCSPAFLPLLLLFVICAPSLSLGQVPATETFRYVNDGELNDYSNEYQATYRTTMIGAHPFQLMFYNTTPGAFILAYRMGTIASESSRYWVWEANRGRPVGDGATLTFAADGNLVLAEADGTVAWSTGTANKGVVALRTTSDGDIILVNKQGKAVWRSFDRATGTLLVGQSLRVGASTRLVSRKSAVEDADGVYSFVLERNGLNFYRGKGAAPVRYGGFPVSGQLTTATFACQRQSTTRYVLKLLTNVGTLTLAATDKDCRYSFLRLGIDGNLVVMTYDDNAVGDAWKQTYAFFPKAPFS